MKVAWGIAIAGMLSEQECEKAYDIWRYFLGFQHIDRFTDAVQKVEGRLGWLKWARDAKQWSTRMAADRMGATQSNWVQLEKAEKAGAIQLKTLQKAAEALDCELVYIIRPRCKQRFSKLMWKTIFGGAADTKVAYRHSQ